MCSNGVPEYYQICSNDEPGLTLTYFMVRSNLVPYPFVWQKSKTKDFSETIVVYDIKVGRCNYLNEDINLYEYQRSRTFIDLGHSDSTFSNFFSLETARPIEAKFCAELPGDGRVKICSNGPGHMTNMAAMPIDGKNLKKIFLCETKKQMILKVGMHAASGTWVLSS